MKKQNGTGLCTALRITIAHNYFNIYNSVTWQREILKWGAIATPNEYVKIRSEEKVMVWIRRWSDVAYLGWVQQSCGRCQQHCSYFPSPTCKWGASMMVSYACHHLWPRISQLHEAGHHQIGNLLLSCLVWGRLDENIFDLFPEPSFQQEATSQVTSSPLPAQHWGHCPQWRVGLKWRENCVK